MVFAMHTPVPTFLGEINRNTGKCLEDNDAYILGEFWDKYPILKHLGMPGNRLGADGRSEIE